MILNSNQAASSVARTLNHSQAMLTASLNRLSSGSRITRPSDDVAGLAVSETMDAETQRLGAASANVQNATSYLQTADGFLGSMGKMLSRLGELATLAKDVTKTPADIQTYQQEFQVLQQQLRDTIGGGIVSAPQGVFNGITLFGSNPAGLTVAVGAGAGQTLNIPETDLQDPAGALGVFLAQTSPPAFDVNVTATNVVSAVTDGIQQVAGARATLGATRSRLDLVAASLDSQSLNQEAAVSRIRDVDVATESARLAKNNILTQAGTAMLAQANQIPQTALKLLQ